MSTIFDDIHYKISSYHTDVHHLFSPRNVEICDELEKLVDINNKVKSLFKKGKYVGIEKIYIDELGDTKKLDDYLVDHPDGISLFILYKYQMYNNLGIIYAKSKHYDYAVEFFSKALAYEMLYTIQDLPYYDDYESFEANHVSNLAAWVNLKKLIPSLKGENPYLILSYSEFFKFICYALRLFSEKISEKTFTNMFNFIIYILKEDNRIATYNYGTTYPEIDILLELFDSKVGRKELEGKHVKDHEMRKRIAAFIVEYYKKIHAVGTMSHIIFVIQSEMKIRYDNQ